MQSERLNKSNGSNLTQRPQAGRPGDGDSGARGPPKAGRPRELPKRQTVAMAGNRDSGFGGQDWATAGRQAPRTAGG